MAIRKLKHIESITLSTSEGAVLILSPKEGELSKGNEKFEAAYSEEGFQIAQFLNENLSIKTLQRVREFLPK